MENVISKVKSFLSGLGGLMMAVLPITILWQVLTGGLVFGMDVIANLTSIISSLGDAGFVGLVVLVLVASFFTDKN
mgnify:FL=1